MSLVENMAEIKNAATAMKTTLAGSLAAWNNRGKLSKLEDLSAEAFKAEKNEAWGLNNRTGHSRTVETQTHAMRMAGERREDKRSVWSDKC